MNICGIIAEYNPFHNGHKYQLDILRKQFDGIVVVMSGSFVQRGNIAITDKWTRAKAALLNGADLIIELPVVFSLATAERFAYGGVCLLNELNVINSICFGAECDDINILKNTAHLLLNEPEEISKKIKLFMSEGISYPAARCKAYEKYIPQEVLSMPNNILAVEYIKHLIELKSNIIPLPLKRHKVGYHQMSIVDNIASASAIRKMLNDDKSICNVVPQNTLFQFDNVFSINQLDTAIISAIRIQGKEMFKDINDVSEGIENRIVNTANSVSTIEQLSNSVKSKRYTKTRIDRIILNSFLQIKKDLIYKKPEYIRIIGMNKTGMKILKQIKLKSNIDIITKTAKYKTKSDFLKKDILSTDIFSLCSESDFKKNAGLDYIKSPVII